MCVCIAVTSAFAEMMWIDVNGVMVEVGTETKAATPEYSQEFKQAFYQELIGYAESKRFKPGWAFYAYQDKLEWSHRRGLISLKIAFIRSLPIHPAPKHQERKEARQMNFEQFASAHGLIVNHIDFGKWVRTQTTDKPGHKNGAYKHMGDVAFVQNHATMPEVACWFPDKESEIKIDRAEIERIQRNANRQIENNRKEAAEASLASFAMQSMSNTHISIQKASQRRWLFITTTKKQTFWLFRCALVLTLWDAN